MLLMQLEYSRRKTPFLWIIFALGFYIKQNTLKQNCKNASKVLFKAFVYTYIHTHGVFFSPANGAVSEHTQRDARRSLIVFCVHAGGSLKARAALEPHERAAAWQSQPQAPFQLVYVGFF